MGTFGLLSQECLADTPWLSCELPRLEVLVQASRTRGHCLFLSASTSWRLSLLALLVPLAIGLSHPQMLRAVHALELECSARGILLATLFAGHAVLSRDLMWHLAE
mmetsp:Transcript_30383/g.92790  ORF Transcript_30383/g.92790 Transcript_30383/m.92790 type:complete len:106 (+) Transcript_30383:345-662(+)